MAELRFDGRRVLFFPVTPFGDDGAPRLDLLAAHIVERLAHDPGAVFAACGTGEFHALALDEYQGVVDASVRAAAGRVPVITGCGGQLGHALQLARAAHAAGADGLLVMPPYLVAAPRAGLVRYVETIADATPLPLIVYHRGSAQFDGLSVERLFAHPRVLGFKDGVGDLAIAQEHVRAAVRAGRADAAFFNGLPTAEVTQPSFDAIGITDYSSAAFAMAPDVATAYLRALRSGDEEARLRLLDRFYLPLVRLRDQVPGYAVALIKAGVALAGLPVGPVRPPLVDPTPEHVAQLAAIIDQGRDAIG